MTVATQRQMVVAVAIMEQGPLHDHSVADVLAAASLGISTEPLAVQSYCRTLKRLGLIDRTAPFGPAVWRLTRKGEALAASVRRPADQAPT